MISKIYVLTTSKRYFKFKKEKEKNDVFSLRNDFSDEVMINIKDIYINSRLLYWIQVHDCGDPLSFQKEKKTRQIYLN